MLHSTAITKDVGDGLNNNKVLTLNSPIRHQWMWNLCISSKSGELKVYFIHISMRFDVGKVRKLTRFPVAKLNFGNGQRIRADFRKWHRVSWLCDSPAITQLLVFFSIFWYLFTPKYIWFHQESFINVPIWLIFRFDIFKEIHSGRVVGDGLRIAVVSRVKYIESGNDSTPKHAQTPRGNSQLFSTRGSNFYL